jgi:diguanylate cyclase (GGDEF)-like protein/PAS domain S-box-containing protein
MHGRVALHTILLVEDSDSDRQYLAVQLVEAGYNVLESVDGRDVEAVLEKTRIDLILLDVVLPQTDGLTILKKLRLKHTAVGLPIIMLTSRGESDDIVEALSLGANDYVTKPADLPVLLARVRTHLSLKQAKESLRESEERYSLAVLGANDGIWDWNLKTGDIYFSPRWKMLVGFGEHDFQDTVDEWFRRVHPEDLGQVKESVQFHLDSLNDHLEVEYRMMDKDGRFRWMLTRGMAIRDPAGKAYRMAGSQTDITESKLTDALSGLPNRALFMDRLTHANRLLRRQPEATFAVLIIDIDRFNLVNESLGQAVGDILLQDFSKRLLECLRPSDTVARIGGDQFVVLLDGVAAGQDISNFVDRVKKKMSFPFRLEEKEVFLTVSVGVVYSSPDYAQPEDIVRDAQTALRRAKSKGVANFEVFDATMHAKVVRRFQMESELRRAIDQEEFFLCYHPIVGAEDENLGFEALVRWKHPKHGTVPPDEFISIAEETGLILPLGEFVLRTACVGIKSLGRRGWGEHSVAVNFSGRQFQQRNVVETVGRTLKISGFDPTRLKVELTESILMENIDDTIMKLRQLRDMGIQVSIDDFGTGYSSLSYLKKFPITTLKIDKSFVKDIEVDPGAESIVRATIAMAHNLNLEVVAEGVETENQAAFLRNHGCNYLQGYLYGIPMPIEELEMFLASDSGPVETADL